MGDSNLTQSLRNGGFELDSELIVGGIIVGILNDSIGIVELEIVAGEIVRKELIVLNS